MKVYMLLLLSLLSCISATSAEEAQHNMLENDQNTDGGNTVIDLHKKLKESSRRLNKFSFDMQKELSKAEDGNIVFSPFSIYTALSMVGFGASEETLNQISNVLGWGHEKPIRDMGIFYGEISGDSSDGASISVANRAWVSKQMKLLTSFRGALEEKFQSEIGREEFEKDPETARRNINDWVSTKTNGKIEDLFPQGSINAMTKLVLANAIYFKGKWVKEFETRMGCRGKFLLGGVKDGDNVDEIPEKEEGKRVRKCGFSNDNARNYVLVDFMHLTHHFPYFGDCELGAHVVELPYEGGMFSMLLVVPMVNPSRKVCKKGTTFPKYGWKDLADKLTAPLLDGWLAKLSPRRVNLALPKFELTQSFDLTSTLKGLGVQDAFSDKADLSGINGEKDLRVSAAVHKTFLRVHEGGTEAASSTGITMQPRMRVESVMINVDQPFFFYIVHKSCNAIVFSGRLLNPKA